jgi:hypothetical protein
VRTGCIIDDPDEVSVRLPSGKVGVRVRRQRIPQGVVEEYCAWKYDR